MLEFHMIRVWVQSHVDAARSTAREDPERGDIVQQVIYTALVAAATLLVVAILVAKAKSAATHVKTQ
jgi:hypothetical protein